MCTQVQLSKDIKDFIRKSTSNYGKVKLVLQRNSFFVESKYPEVLRELLRVRLSMCSLMLAVHGVDSKQRCLTNTPCCRSSSG